MLNVIDKRYQMVDEPDHLTVADLNDGDTFYATLVPEAKYGKGLFLYVDGVVVRLDEVGSVWIPGGRSALDDSGETWDDSAEMRFFNVEFVDAQLHVTELF
jgi:hypothetical protein